MKKVLIITSLALSICLPSLSSAARTYANDTLTSCYQDSDCGNYDGVYCKKQTGATQGACYKKSENIYCYKPNSVCSTNSKDTESCQRNCCSSSSYKQGSYRFCN